MIAATAADGKSGAAQGRPAMTEPYYASFGVRAMAWVVDTVPLIVIPYFVGELLGGWVPALASFFIVGIVWSIVPEARTGATPGKLLSGIRVLPAESDIRMGLGRSAVRWLVKYVVCGVLPVGYLWYFRDRRHRAWQDLAAGSVVIDIARGPAE